MPDPTVLVVDDDPVIVRLLEITFAMEDFAVLAAVDGVEGLEMATAKHPDVVVCDIMMPRLDGLDLVKALKAAPDTAHIPVVLLSAKAQIADLEAGAEVGAAAYVTKPFEPFDLIDQVRAILARE